MYHHTGAHQELQNKQTPSVMSAQIAMQAPWSSPPRRPWWPMSKSAMRDAARCCSPGHKLGSFQAMRSSKASANRCVSPPFLTLRLLPACICAGSGRVEQQRRVERSRRVLQAGNARVKPVATDGASVRPVCVACHARQAGSRLICSRHRSTLKRPRAHGGCERGAHYHTLH